MKVILVAISLIGLVGTASAQSAFEGFYGQIGVGYENNTISTTTVTATPSGQASVIDRQDNTNSGNFSGLVTIGYNHSVSEGFLLGIGLDYSPISTSTFNTGRTINNNIGGYEISNRYSVFISPGYKLEKDKLVYLKAGYSTQYIKSTDQTPGASTKGQTTGSGNANGVIAGLGYKQIIDKGFYGFGEANYYSYSGASFSTVTLSDGTRISNFSPKSSAYQFLVGVGYKF